ncbi:hypothetical protein CR513_47519, partial [Mucuna pruriens]
MVYEARGHVKAQVLANFINELTPNPHEKEEEEANKRWTLSVDGSSNKKCSRAGIILEGSTRVSLHFGFRASNNQVEYEALLARIRLEKELGAIMLTVKSNSQLVTRQKGGLHRTIIQEALGCPIIKEAGEVQRIKRKVTKYFLIAGQLYRRGFSYPLLRCLGEAEVERAVKEIHEGACGRHIGGRALANKIARVGFYWSTIKKDSLAFVKKCDKCQCYSNWHQAPTEPLHSMTSRWPFYMWGGLANSHNLGRKSEAFFIEGRVYVVLDFRLLYASHSNGQAEATNRVILRGLRIMTTNLKLINLLQDEREMAHICEYAAKARVAKRYNSTIFPYPLRQGDLVLKRVLKGATTNKLAPNWEGPYRAREDVGHGAFILEQLNRKLVLSHLEYCNSKKIL